MLDFDELYSYNLWANKKLMAQMGTWPFLGPTRRWFCHILNAHHLWNQRVLGLPARLSVWSEHDFKEVSKINGSNHDDTLLILHSLDLKTQITYTTSKGDVYESVLEDILFHVINHSTHHRAQILVEMRNGGGRPESLDYIFFRRD